MTPQGPAMIQIIDMGGTGLGPANAPTIRRKPGGINVLGAVTRRWWLVLVVFLTVGGGAFLAGANIKPSFEGRAKVSYTDNNPNASGGGIANSTVHKALELLNSKDIPLTAWRSPVMHGEFPEVAPASNLDDPVNRAALLTLVKALVDYEESARGSSVVDIIALQPSPAKAAAVANAYAQALCDYCTSSVKDTVDQTIKSLKGEYENESNLLAALKKQETKLKSETNFDAMDQKLLGTLDQIKGLTADRTKAQVAAALAQAKYNALKSGNHSAGAQLDAIKLKQDGEEKDSILKTYEEQYAAAVNDVLHLTGTVTDNHPEMIAAKLREQIYKKNVEDRKAEIDRIIDKNTAEQLSLKSTDTLDQANDALSAAKATLDGLNKQLDSQSEEVRSLSNVKMEIEELDRQSVETAKLEDQAREDLNAAQMNMINNPTATFKVEQMAAVSPKSDTRIKVQAGGLVGGLFLGILLSLLVDKFDKRLRDPRDIEPLLGTPLLGTIPRISELKKIKGEQARNLIAEEFRIIRTQILFGNPNLHQKLIAITSPSPGDGKTSLAVNLAISIAKAGRRVLLIDGDLRKPDVHRVFNISDSPGFAEVIQGSHEPGAVIKKTEVDGLEVLPAGTPITRPSELLSRPEMARLLAALSELYDHIVLDTAPLLPVSDTHVLIGMMDGVIVSFNAEVDRDTVSMTQEILLRNRANVIGSVMNQVKYKQSGSYHRGKSAYSSYYNSSRGAPAAKSDKLTPAGR
jgi:capsular exopolysaccharide synthesis family protein